MIPDDGWDMRVTPSMLFVHCDPSYGAFVPEDIRSVLMADNMTILIVEKSVISSYDEI